jgi:hypothetical protein
MSALLQKEIANLKIYAAQLEDLRAAAAAIAEEYELAERKAQKALELSAGSTERSRRIPDTPPSGLFSQTPSINITSAYSAEQSFLLYTNALPAEDWLQQRLAADLYS